MVSTCCISPSPTVCFLKEVSVLPTACFSLLLIYPTDAHSQGWLSLAPLIFNQAAWSCWLFPGGFRLLLFSVLGIFKLNCWSPCWISKYTWSWWEIHPDGGGTIFMKLWELQNPTWEELLLPFAASSKRRLNYRAAHSIAKQQLAKYGIFYLACGEVSIFPEGYLHPTIRSTATYSSFCRNCKEKLFPYSLWCRTELAPAWQHMGRTKWSSGKKGIKCFLLFISVRWGMLSYFLFPFWFSPKCIPAKMEITSSE